MSEEMAGPYCTCDPVIPRAQGDQGRCELHGFAGPDLRLLESRLVSVEQERDEGKISYESLWLERDRLVVRADEANAEASRFEDDRTEARERAGRAEAELEQAHEALKITDEMRRRGALALADMDLSVHQKLANDRKAKPFSFAEEADAVLRAALAVEGEQ